MSQEPVINVYPPASPGWLSGLFVLLGAVVGGGFAFLTTWRSDVRKLEREDDRRWDDELRSATSQFVEAVATAVAAGAAYHNSVSAELKAMAIDETDANATQTVPDKAQEDKRNAAKRRAEFRKPRDEGLALMTGRLVGLLVVAPERVRLEANSLYRLAEQDMDLSGDERKAVRKQLEAKLDELCEEVRRSLRSSQMGSNTGLQT